MAYLPENNIIKQVLDILEEARAGDKNRLQSYLQDNNISINLKNTFGKTASYLAAEHNLLTELTTLIEAGANVNISKSRNRINTPIMIASEYGHFECLQALIKSGAQVNDLNINGRSPLMLAIGKLNCFEALIEAGACVNQRTIPGVPILNLVSSKQELQALINAGADVNITDQSGRTTLMRAAKGGNPIIVKTLLQAKVHPDKQDRDGKTALMYTKDNDCVKTLLSEGGADPNKQDVCGYTALMYICRDCKPFYENINDRRITAVNALLEAGADVNVTNSLGHTALMIAAKNGDLSIVRNLLQAKADPNKQDRDGKTALMYAELESCVQALIDNGANMELEDNSQSTALIFALKECARKLALLLFNGANPTIYWPHRLWLHELLLFEHDHMIWALIKDGYNWILQFLVCNGIVIDYSKIYTSRSRKKSPVGNALYRNELDSVKYFVANCYLTYDDLKDMRKILHNKRREWLITHGFDRCKLTEKQSDHPLNEVEINLAEIEDETHEFLEQALNEPWPLVKLAFIAVSSALGPSPLREYGIQKIGLPERLQSMLMFQEPVSRLPIGEWDDIPLTFDPVEYEKLPKPRPLLYYWPVGRDLDI